jgi:hypothetical protein
MKVAGSSPGDALGASGQLNKVETAERRQVTAAAAPVACVACKRLPVLAIGGTAVRARWRRRFYR